MPQSRSPVWSPVVGGGPTLQGQSVSNLTSADDGFFGQDPVFLLDEYLQSLYSCESPCPPADQELGNEKNPGSNGYVDPRSVVGSSRVEDYGDSYIDPRLLGGLASAAAEPEILSGQSPRGSSYSPEQQRDPEVGGPYPPLYDLDEYLGGANQSVEPENTGPESSPTRSPSVISIPSTPMRLSSPRAPGVQESSPAPAADALPRRITRSASRRDPAAAPVDAKPERDQLPTMNADQTVTQNFHPANLEAPAGDLASVGCVMVVQKIKDSGIEVPILYSIYQPLQNWGKSGQFRYTERGNLHQDVTFDEESLHEFIYSHPMKQNLTLRIERHPYGFQCRYRNSPYMKCRSKKCSVGNTKSFKVGDFRVAVDEVAGRLGPNQFNDNDPYFAACYFHLQCFEDLTYTPDLVIRNVIVIDDRQCHNKEPECTRGNKMGVAPATVVAFNKWRETAIKKLGEDAAWQPPEKETLAVVIWLSSIRKGRKRARAPPGITSDDIKQKCSTHPGWGGKRVSGLSVADMVEMVQQGRSSEMVASRNGKTGKKGVKEPEPITRKRLMAQADDGSSKGCFALEEPTMYHSATVAGPSSQGDSRKTTSEKENQVRGNDDGSPPAKRRRQASATPEYHPEVFGSGATKVPDLSTPEKYRGDTGIFLDSPYGASYLPHPYFPPNNYYPPPTTYYTALAQHYSSPSSNLGFQAANNSPQSNYYDHLAGYCGPQETNYVPTTNPGYLPTLQAPIERFGEGRGTEGGIDDMSLGGTSSWCHWD